ncbi:MAG: hypothetical protein Q9217_005992, partial [Psora testacea]
PSRRKIISVLGLATLTIATVAASFATHVIHLVFTQGLLYGVGGAMLYNPFIFYLDDWFIERKGLAYGIFWAGTGVCSSAMPFVMEWALNNYDFRTTLRAWAIFVSVTLAVLIYLVRPRKPLPSKSVVQGVNLGFLKTPLFWAFQAGNIIEGLGYFVPQIYLPSYAQTVGLSRLASTLSVSLLNISSTLGLIFMGYLIDRYHISTVLLISALTSSLSVFLFWGFATSSPLLYLFSITFGVFAGGYTASWTGSAQEIKKANPASTEIAVVMGTMAAGRGLGCVLSGPISEALMALPAPGKGKIWGSAYGWLILFTGVTCLLGRFGLFGKWGMRAEEKEDMAAMSDSLTIPHLTYNETQSSTGSDTASWLTRRTSQSSIDSEALNQGVLDHTTKQINRQQGEHDATDNDCSIAITSLGDSVGSYEYRGHGFAEQRTNIIDIRRDKSQLSLATSIRESLKAPQPSLPSMALWDTKGLELFERVTETEDYYLGRVESEILERQAEEIAQMIADGSMIVDLGCGNAHKIRPILHRLDELGRDIDYYALDLSLSEIERSLDTLSSSYSFSWQHIHCHGLLGTFEDARHWLQTPENLPKPKCLVSLGSSIGNEPGPEAVNFLAGFADVLRRSDAVDEGPLRGESNGLVCRKSSSFIIGLDSTKDFERIRGAYADLAGANAEFIINGLSNANSVLGYEAFQTEEWAVIGEWSNGCWNQNLVPVVDVMFEGVCIKAGDRVHVVQSKKYDGDQKQQLWKAAGLKELYGWSCTDRSFGCDPMVSMLAVEKKKGSSGHGRQFPYLTTSFERDHHLCKMESDLQEPYVVEQDPRWTAVDDFQFPHLNPPSRPYHEAIEHAATNSMAKGLRDIAVSRSQGKFLSVQCQLIGAKNVLEVGTLGAYSTIWMASSNLDVKVVTIEINPEIAEIAKENIKYAGLEDRIEVIVGAAGDVLPNLFSEVQQGRRENLDFSFIDADKESALVYFDWCVKMTRKKGAVYVDNMVRKGLLADAELEETDSIVKGIRTATRGIGKDERVDAVILQTVGEKNYDGFLLAIVK